MKKPDRSIFVDARGFALPAVLVFALLLSLSAFAGAFLTRTDVQIVNNGHDEKEAFYVAEAGISEAQLRLAMPVGTMMTVDGNTFDASIRPLADPLWQGTILFGGTGPVSDAVTKTLTTPTIQPGSDRLLYSTAAADSEALTMRWAKDAGGNILKIAGRNVLELVSTGQSGRARRRVTQQAIQVTGTSIFVFSNTACPALTVGGSVSIKTAGSIQVNSSCSGALSLGGASSMKSVVGTVDVVGGISGNPKAISPLPNTGVSPLPDPLASRLPPCFANYSPASGCVDMSAISVDKYGATPNGMTARNASEGSPKTLQINRNTSIRPGVYYGGIQIKGGTANMESGVYVMAGGGFSVASKANAVGNGVMIYNTQNPVSQSGDGAIGPITFSTGSGSINLSADASGPFQGLLIFQDRDMTSQPAITVSGGFSGVLDGVIYALKAPLIMQGGCTLKTELVVGTLTMGGNAEIQPPPNPVSTMNGGFSPIAWIDY